MNVVSFSGGKDSTALLLMMIEKGIPIDDIVFCDTGAEFPQMYEHIKKVESYTGRKVTRLQAKHDFWYYAKEYKKVKGNHMDDLGYSWPTAQGRWCTRALKQQPVARYLKGKNVQQYIGIAVDEAHRCKEYNYPLVDWGVTEEMALKYCYDHGFAWDGLYKIFKRVSCWCCPLQSIGEARNLRKHFPELWERLKIEDTYMRNSWKADYTVEALEKRFAADEAYLLAQQTLFCEVMA